jgi:hypothetical protein
VPRIRNAVDRSTVRRTTEVKPRFGHEMPPPLEINNLKKKKSARFRLLQRAMLQRTAGLRLPPSLPLERNLQSGKLNWTSAQQQQMEVEAHCASISDLEQCPELVSFVSPKIADILPHLQGSYIHNFSYSLSNHTVREIEAKNATDLPWRCS